jgi:hypothetical protein
MTVSPQTEKRRDFEANFCLQKAFQGKLAKVSPTLVVIQGATY